MTESIISGVNKRMSITLKSEGYADIQKEWLVPEELVRAYTIAFDAAIAAAGVKISQSIYEKLIDGGFNSAETMLAEAMVTAND